MTLAIAALALAPVLLMIPGGVETSSKIDVNARWFSDTSPLNTPIPADAEVDRNSARYVKGIVHAAEKRGWTISVKRWTVPVYYAGASTPRRDVRLTASWRPANMLLGVPIPGNARPDPGGSSGTDGHMAIVDRSTGCFYEFYEATRRGDGTWEAKWANRGLLSGAGIQPGGWSTRASGFVNFAGLIRPGELRAGAIDHALSFGYPYTKAGGPVLPATSSDGRPASESGRAIGDPRPRGALALPEGARVQLDPALDLDELDLAPWQRVVARALQVYGMFLTDTSAGLGLGAVGAQSFRSNPYLPFWGDAAYAELPASLARHLRVLELGRQRKLQGHLVASPCARFAPRR